jgi:hypothetical protein
MRSKARQSHVRGKAAFDKLVCFLGFMQQERAAIEGEIGV